MINNLSLGNVIPWYKFASDFAMPELLEPCRQLLCTNFPKLVAVKKLHALEVSGLKPLLQSSDLVVESEKAVVDFIIDWLFTGDRTCHEDHKDWLVELLQCARLQYLKPQELYDLEKNEEIKSVMPRVIERFHLGFKYFVFGSKMLQDMSEENKKLEMPRIYLAPEHSLIQVHLGDTTSGLVVEPRRYMTILSDWELMCKAHMEQGQSRETAMQWAVEVRRAGKDDNLPARVDMTLCPKTNIGCSSVTFKIVTVFTITSPTYLPNVPNHRTRMIGTAVVKKFFRSLYGEFWVPLHVHASEKIPHTLVTSATKTDVQVLMYCIGKTHNPS